MSTFRKIMMGISMAAGATAMAKPEWAAWLVPISAIAANFNGGAAKQPNGQ